MDESFSVGFVVRQDDFGRLGTISVSDFVHNGWLVLPGQPPAWIELMATDKMPLRPSHIGQGAVILRPIDFSRSDPSLSNARLLHGLIVSAPVPPALAGAVIILEVLEDSILPRVCPPAQEQLLRETAPELFEGESLELELEVWYPIELGGADKIVGCGVLQLVSKQPDRRMTANLRWVRCPQAEATTSSFLHRFGRRFGRILQIVEG